MYCVYDSGAFQRFSVEYLSFQICFWNKWYCWKCMWCTWLYVLKGILRKKIGFWHFNALRSSFKVPASATPNEDDRMAVHKRVWVSEWVVMSCQESQNTSSSGNCCFSSGEEFSSTKDKQTEVGEAMWSSSKQNKNRKLWDVPEVMSFVTNLSLRCQRHWVWPKQEI